MSIRCCANCDTIVDNRTWNEDCCPECGHDDWSDPLEDDRDWQKMHLQQKLELYKDIAKAQSKVKTRFDQLLEDIKYSLTNPVHLDLIDVVESIQDLIKDYENEMGEEVKSEEHPDERKEHFVYFIKEKAIFGKDVHLKIGYSKDHKKRLAQLQTGHPNELGLGGLIKCTSRSEAIALEAEMHKRFKAARKHGEWFYENNHLRTFLATEARTEFKDRYYRCFF